MVVLLDCITKIQQRNNVTKFFLKKIKIFLVENQSLTKNFEKNFIWVVFYPRFFGVFPEISAKMWFSKILAVFSKTPPANLGGLGFCRFRKILVVFQKTYGWIWVLMVSIARLKPASLNIR